MAVEASASAKFAAARKTMADAFICDAVRTPIGRYGGALASVRADDLAAVPLRTLMQRNTEADWERLDDVVMGCANQAGEDNRNVARMALLLAGLPTSVSATTVNRLCGSGLDATARTEARAPSPYGRKACGFQTRRRRTERSLRCRRHCVRRSSKARR